MIWPKSVIYKYTFFYKYRYNFVTYNEVYEKKNLPQYFAEQAEVEVKDEKAWKQTHFSFCLNRTFGGDTPDYSSATLHL